MSKLFKGQILTFLMAIAVVLSCHSARAQSVVPAVPLGTGPWVHPGVLLNKAQLDWMAQEVNAGVEPWATEFANAKTAAPGTGDQAWGSLTYAVEGPVAGGMNQCGSDSSPNDGCSAADSDSSAAYIQALLWYITGNQTYANNSMSIMNHYASNLKGYAFGSTCPQGAGSSSCENAPLQAAWDSSKWPRAAEIIYYGRPASTNGQAAGWSEADFNAFGIMLTNVYVPLIENGSPDNNNWELTMIEGLMGIAVDTENYTQLQTAQTMWLERVPASFYDFTDDGDTASASGDAWPVPAPRANADFNWNGQQDFNAETSGVEQETCPDTSHMEYGVSAAIAAAETDYIQTGNGIGLYTSKSVYMPPAPFAGPGFNVDAEDRLTRALNVASGIEIAASTEASADFCTGASDAIDLAGNGSTYVIGYNEYHNRLNSPSMTDTTGAGTTGVQGTSNTYNWINDNGIKIANDTDSGAHLTVFEALTNYSSPPQTVVSLTASPSSLSITSGAASATSSIAESNFTGTVTLTDTLGSSGCTDVTASISGTTLTVSASGAAPSETCDVTVTGTSGAQTASAAVPVTVTPPVTSCETVGATWTNTPFAAQTGTFTIIMTATPSGSPINAVIGLADNSQSAYADLTTVVRFNPSGDIDAYNGGSTAAYQAASTIPYKAATAYAFEIDVNIAAQTYSAYVTPAGGVKTLIGQNFVFRKAATTLNNLSVYSEVGSDTVCSFSLGTPVANFSLAVSPSSQTVTAGGSTSYTAMVTPSNGFTGLVSLSASGLPSGAAATFTPASVSGGSGTSSVAVTTSSTTPAGTYTLTLTGVSGTLTQTATATLVVSPASSGGGGDGSKMFAPYIDMSITADENIVSLQSASGVNAFTLAFLDADAACDIGWGGLGGTLPTDTLADGTSILTVVQQLKAAGVTPIFSIGGANGSDPAAYCTSASSLQAVYQTAVTRYGITYLDFDIEGASTADEAEIELRDQALLGLMAANPRLVISYTIPVLPTGLVAGDGLNLLTSAKSDGVDLSVVNIMTMDYGTSGIEMGSAATEAAAATEAQIIAAGLTSTVGITPMIGQNDSAGEIFTPADATTLLNFANENSYVTRLAMWSMGRDNGSCSGDTKASPTCSGVSQATYAFSDLFKAF
jgi:hypothetical protein